MTSLLELEPWRTWVVLGPLGIVLVAAAISDLRDRTVPNVLTYPAVGVGLIVQTVALGWGGLASAAIALAVLFPASLLLVMVPGLGGGDLKLLLATGAFLGLSRMAPVFFYAVWVGFGMGILKALFGGYIGHLFGRLWRYIKGAFRVVYYRTTMVAEPYEESEATSVPFAVAILAGAILAYTEAAFEWPGFWSWYLEQFAS